MPSNTYIYIYIYICNINEVWLCLAFAWHNHALFILHLLIYYDFLRILLFLKIWIVIKEVVYLNICIYTYAILKTMSPTGYHHNGFVATHAFGHMMYGHTLLVTMNQIMLNKPSKEHNISGHKWSTTHKVLKSHRSKTGEICMPSWKSALLLWDLSTLYICVCMYIYIYILVCFGSPRSTSSFIFF